MSVALAEAPAPLGHNNPPEPTPYEAVKIHLDDLLTEAGNWADGSGVENQAQADEVSRLIEDLRKGGDAADDARLTEGKPFKVKLDAIQTRWNVYIAGFKSKVKNPGKVPVAIDALKATLKPFLDRLAAEKAAAEAAARRIAEEASRKAAEAFRTAQASDLAARQAAEALEAEARAAQARATAAANDKAHAKGGSKAMGLTRTWTPVMVDRKAALIHYAKTRPEDLQGFLQGLAAADVREGKRQIPGFDIQEGTRL
jgi:hypothetical protein